MLLELAPLLALDTLAVRFSRLTGGGMSVELCAAPLLCLRNGVEFLDCCCTLLDLKDCFGVEFLDC